VLHVVIDGTQTINPVNQVIVHSGYNRTHEASIVSNLRKQYMYSKGSST